MLIWIYSYYAVGVLLPNNRLLSANIICIPLSYTQSTDCVWVIALMKTFDICNMEMSEFLLCFFVIDLFRFW